MDKDNIESHFDVTKFEHIKNYDEIKALLDKIEDLYYTFYKNERNNLLQTNISNLLKLIDAHLQNSNQLSKDEISFLYFIKSLSLDKLPEYTKESEESVNKSVSIYKINLYIIIFIVKIKSFYSRQL